MRGRPSGSVPTIAAMTGGTAIRTSFRVNGSPPLSARFAERVSDRTSRQNTVPERVSTHQDNHNHERRNAAFFVPEINSQANGSMVKRMVQYPNARRLYPNAGRYIQMQGGYIQTQGVNGQTQESHAFDH